MPRRFETAPILPVMLVAPALRVRRSHDQMSVPLQDATAFLQETSRLIKMFNDVAQINCVKRFVRQSELAQIAPVTSQSSRLYALDTLRIEFNPFNFPAVLLHLLQHRTV